MQGSTEEKFYVATLKIPTFFYLTDEKRGSICRPEAFGISKGYWILHSLSEQPDENGCAEFVLVIDFPCGTLKSAEDHALKVGKTFGTLASCFSGYPVVPPELFRIASVDSAGRLLTQTNYWYGQKLHMLTGFDQTVEYRFQRYIEHVSSVSEETRHQLQSAIHWYGISMAADHPTVSIVAAWTGLECIGKELDIKFHPNGAKAPCEICQNNPGQKRDRKIAGIKHVFCSVNREFSSGMELNGIRELVADDLIENFDAEDAAKLRNAIVHGLQDIDVLTERCTEVKRHLFHVLNASIQNIMEVSSGITGHYEFHPNGRTSLKFSDGLSKSPYYGEWLEGFSSISEPTKPGTSYVATTGFEWSPPDNIAPFVETKSQEVFERDAKIYQTSDESVLGGLSTWHSRPDEPEWE